MMDEPRIQQLLDELVGSDATPEDVCASYPELLPMVRNRWRQMCRVQADLDALFPVAGEPTPLPAEKILLPQVACYDVDAVLGRGGMGIVFRARHLRLNRLVALKMALAGAYAEPRERARFQREAEAIAELRHPNIVQIYDVGDADGRPYFTMEYIEGGSLAQKLASIPQPPDQAARLTATLAVAIEAAHRSGIVHRDLKPANVLLTADGIPKITDFGLARRRERDTALTQSGVPVGTPSYMAPEQAQGQTQAIGPAVDVYALGAILYELLTGRPPFRGETQAETVLQVISREPAPPRRLNAKVPRDLETICLKCLQKTPKQRYATAQALADDLERYERGESIAARRVSPVERLARWVRRKPAATALIVTALALVGLASAWVITKWKRDAEAAETGLVRKLEQIRFDQAAVVDGRYVREENRARRGRAYEAALAENGIATVRDDPTVAAARIRGSHIRAPLVGALDDWSICTTDVHQRGWIFAIARGADPDGWRDRVRNPALSKEALTQLADTADVAKQPVQLLVALAQRLRDVDADSAPLLRRIHQQYPGDFCASLTLADVLWDNKPDEAVRYYQAALALRPDAAAVHFAVAWSLMSMGQIDETIAHLREAIRLEPKFARARSMLGMFLADTGKSREGIELAQQAVQLEKCSYNYANLARAYTRVGQTDAAIDACRQALALDPKDVNARVLLATQLDEAKHFDEALKELDVALRIDPTTGGARVAKGRMLRRVGRIDEAMAEFEQATQLREQNYRAWAHYDLGECFRGCFKTLTG